MFVGHMALAFVAKTRSAKASLGLCLAATFALDLLWPIFLLTGIERVRIDPGNTAFTPLAFDSYPWSHSLVMAVVWGVVGYAVASRFRADVAARQIVGLLVVSHWVLDVVSHRPDLPLWPGASPLLGLGLWNSIGATLTVEGALFAAAVALYLQRTRPIDRIGTIAFWLLILMSLALWVAGPWSPPPPSAGFLAWFGLGAWLFPPWGAWIDRHRSLTPP
jgi:hypothetical protein